MERSLPETRVLDDSEVSELLSDPPFAAVYLDIGGELVLEHERVPFPSFPYEWPAEMLHSAANLTLDLARRALPEGLGLKDATPLNVLFRGPDPVFVDVLSFEQRNPLDYAWLPYAQFVRTFLFPLLGCKYFGLSLDQILTSRRDGLEPEEVYRWLRPLQKVRPPFLQLASIPTWLTKSKKAESESLYKKKLSNNSEKARFILDSLLNGLRRSLKRLSPENGAKSVWSDYATNNSYSGSQSDSKQRFVGEMLNDFQPRTVLDAGCNTGQFSMIAARSGAAVVAIDYDPVVVGALWTAARAQKLDVLPLVVNLARPTPATGWNNEEFPSFLDRARGHFDAVLMLAVLHHMLVTERVPLNAILKLAAELTRDALIIEFVGTEDPMFRRIARGREALHADLTKASFETAAAKYFDLVRSEDIEGSARTLYAFRKKSLASA